MPLAIIGLVCLEARVKFKNIDFRTEADFACYDYLPCSGVLHVSYQMLPKDSKHRQTSEVALLC
jgi:hypothetical protein